MPDHYLSVEYLTLLEKYNASGKAKTVSEAVDYLKSELEHRFYFSSSESHQTLLQKKDYLLDEKVNLVKRIEKEGRNLRLTVTNILNQELKVRHKSFSEKQTLILKI